MINFSSSFICDYIETHYPYLELASCGEFAGPGPSSDSGKKHLWVNANSGLWQDFKTGAKGNFIQLIAYLDNLSVSEAQTTLMRKALSAYSIKVQEKASKTKNEERFAPIDFFDILNVTRITEEKILEDARFYRVADFIIERCILNTLKDYPLYLSVGSPYPNRIIIPYIEDGRMFFFQARALNPEDKAKYLTPSKEYGINSSDVVYPFEKGSRKPLFVTEGPLKARLLQSFNLNATAIQGSKMSLRQGQIIVKNHPGDIYLSFDNDEPGNKGQENAFGLLTKKLGVDPNRIYDCRPPKKYNDWEDEWQYGNESIFFENEDPVKAMKPLNMGKLEHLIDRLEV